MRPTTVRPTYESGVVYVDPLDRAQTDRVAWGARGGREERVERTTPRETLFLQVRDLNYTPQ